MSSILERVASDSEAIEDSDVEEGDWRGLSKGEGETELGRDESVVGARCRATGLGRAVDMLDELRNSFGELDIQSAIPCHVGQVSSSAVLTAKTTRVTQEHRTNE